MFICYHPQFSTISDILVYLYAMVYRPLNVVHIWALIYYETFEDIMSCTSTSADVSKALTFKIPILIPSGGFFT